MLRKEDIIRLLEEAALDAGEYRVTSGAAMVLYGIRDTTRDIDLGCTSSMADKLEKAGYPTEVLPDGSRKTVFSEAVEIFENWLEDRVVIWEGLPVVSIDGLILMKEKPGREKDREDLRLIRRFQNGRAGGRGIFPQPYTDARAAEIDAVWREKGRPDGVLRL